MPWGCDAVQCWGTSRSTGLWGCWPLPWTNPQWVHSPKGLIRGRPPGVHFGELCFMFSQALGHSLCFLAALRQAPLPCLLSFVLCLEAVDSGLNPFECWDRIRLFSCKCVCQMFCTSCKEWLTRCWMVRAWEMWSCVAPSALLLMKRRRRPHESSPSRGKLIWWAQGGCIRKSEWENELKEPGVKC